MRKYSYFEVEEMKIFETVLLQRVKTHSKLNLLK